MFGSGGEYYANSMSKSSITVVKLFFKISIMYELLRNQIANFKNLILVFNLT